MKDDEETLGDVLRAAERKRLQKDKPEPGTLHSTPDWFPLYWDGYKANQATPEKMFVAAWNDFAGMSHADLISVANRCQQRREAFHKALVEAYDGPHNEEVEAAGAVPMAEVGESRIHGPFWRLKDNDGPNFRVQISRLGVFWLTRREAALAVARYVEERGEPPPWQDLTEEAQNAAKREDLNDLEEWLPSATLDKAKRGREMYDEFNRRRDNGEEAATIIDDLSERYSVSESTVESAVYGKNP
jgi:hypothetical protein